MIIPKIAIGHFQRHCERKRFDVLCGLVKEGDRVLDVGCGIGTYTSTPLSYLPVCITAIDSDVKTVDYAKARNHQDNLVFSMGLGERYQSEEKYDLIVCSHILEHVRNPIRLLLNMKKLLKNNGILYVAIPNGFGAFEFQNLIPRLLSDTTWGMQLVNRLRGGQHKDTINVDSQHVNFFTGRQAKRLLERCGWKIIRRVNDEFLGGIVFDRLLSKCHRLARWNSEVADKLPMFMANGWIFVCRKQAEAR